MLRQQKRGFTNDESEAAAGVVPSQSQSAATNSLKPPSITNRETRRISYSKGSNLTLEVSAIKEERVIPWERRR